MRIAVVAALTLLAGAPVAAADPPWSAPRAASPAAAFVGSPGLVFAADGSRLISWNTGEPARGHLATLRPGGAIVQRGTLGGEVVAKPLVTGGRRTVVLTRKRRVTQQFRTLDQLTATFGATTAPRGRTRKVGGSHEVFGEDQGPAMASSGDEVAVAWVEKVGQERHRYRVAFSRSGGKFSRPQTLTTTLLPTRDSESIALAYGPGRKLVAAYDVFAALRTGATGAFDPPERVSTAALDDRGPAVAAFGAARPTVLWPTRFDPAHTRLQISSRAG